jgi:integrase/recombinase XerD
MATMFNTGGRVQEIVDMRVRDLQLIKPFQVRLFGKGKKERYCPLWPETAAVLRSFCKQRKIELLPGAHLFVNHRDQPLSRFGVPHILSRCLGCSLRSMRTALLSRFSPARDDVCASGCRGQVKGETAARAKREQKKQ